MGIIQNFKLIDGIFTSEDADQVVTALINYKIDYHNREDFSNHIRFNHEIAPSKVRIQELMATKEDIKQVIASAKGKNKKLVIKGTISIHFEE